MTRNKNAVEHSRELLLAGEFMTTMLSINKEESFNLWFMDWVLPVYSEMSSAGMDFRCVISNSSCHLLFFCQSLLVNYFLSKSPTRNFSNNFSCVSNVTQRHASNSLEFMSDVDNFRRFFEPESGASHLTLLVISSKSHFYVNASCFSSHRYFARATKRETNKSENYMLQSKNSQMITGFPGIS